MSKKTGYYILALLLIITGSGCKSKHPGQEIKINGDQSRYPAHIKPQAKLAAGYTVRSPYAGQVRYTVTAFNQLPEWNIQYFEQSLAAFKKSCTVLQKQPKWSAVCTVAAALGNNRNDARRFFEDHFQPWVITNANGGFNGKITGYYEPAITGTAAGPAQFPRAVYGIPADFISVPVPENLKNYGGNVMVQLNDSHHGIISKSGNLTATLSQFNITPKTKSIKGRVSGNRFIPYYTRKEIYQGALAGKAQVLAYAQDPVELFFLQIQGSGRVVLNDKTVIRLTYADKNEYPYKSIGTYMAAKGYLPLSQTTMTGIKQYLQEHPGQLEEILGYNPSFVFFKVASDTAEQGPVGALGIPLTAGYSAAVDRHYIDLGAPLFLATTDIRNGKALNRLIIAQDTGAAINGSVRVDYFWGFGEASGAIAGKTNHPGYIWLLLPNGSNPL